MNPQIVIPSFEGYHNSNINTSIRIDKAQTYKDLSTVIICPTRGTIPAKAVQSWMGLIKPMNQLVLGPIFAIRMEVGAAYESMIDHIVNNPAFDNFKYLLTIEEDNLPPPDGLMKLYENIEEYDVIGGLYFTKGEGGQPMIYGNPSVFPKNFTPQIPLKDTIQPANGLGMGFNLFKMSIFRDKRLRRPWFKTEQSYIHGQGVKMYTQDLYFFEDAAKYGYRFACDTRVKVGHYDINSDIVW